jgi:hypothetical protein
MIASEVDTIAHTAVPFSGPRLQVQFSSKVFVNVTKEAILEAPQYHVSPLGEEYGDTRNFD